MLTDVNFLTRKINEETPEHGGAYPFAFFIRDENENIIVGVNGFVIYDAVYTDQLWVDQEYRRQGYARRIMDRVHEFGKLKGCHLATVQIMSFQGAQMFYKKLGYLQDFKRHGYKNGSSCVFMKKLL